MKAIHNWWKLSKTAVALSAALMGAVVYAEDIGVTRADNGDITVAQGGEVTVGPTSTSTNNNGGVTITFENGGTIKATPFDPSGNQWNAFYMWRDYFVNGTVTFDGSDLPSAVVPEFRRSLIATNGALRISADRSTLRLGSGEPNRNQYYPFYDASQIEFLSGSGTIELVTSATLRDVPGINSSGITFNPNGARLAIAGKGIVSNCTSWTTRRVDFSNYGWLIHLLDESYIPEGVTVVVNSGKTFRIMPSDVVVTNEIYGTGSDATRVFWKARAGDGVAPFDINITGGMLDLAADRSTYEFTGKIYGRGTIDLRRLYDSCTIDEIEGVFNFTNTSAAAGSTVYIQKVNPGSRLHYVSGKVNLVFEEGALPANATMFTDGQDKYVFVPAADGSIDTSDIPSQRATDAFIPFSEDATLVASGCQAKIGVTNNAVVSLVFDSATVPTVVGGEGQFSVSTDIPSDLPALWLDASKPYDTAAKGAPYYDPPIARMAGEEGYNCGNIFFTNNYPFVESWYDVRGVERTWRFYNDRFYANSGEHKLYTHVYPYLARGEFAGRTMSYMTFGEFGKAKNTWSNDGPDTPSNVAANGGGNRRIAMVNKPGSGYVRAIVMVFGSQLGGGIAMLGSGKFSRSGRTLSDTVCTNAPANTTIWLDGEQIDPTTSYFNGGWQIVTVAGDAANTVGIIGQDRIYNDAGGQNYGEILFFTNTVSDLQLRQVERYLANKWGIATYKGGTSNALRAEGRSGSIVVEDGAKIELRGTFAGNLTVDGDVSIAEPLPWSADDVPTTGLVDWYDADDTASLEFKTKYVSNVAVATNLVERQYPRGKTRDTLTSGCYLLGGGERVPYAVTGARGIGPERTWLDYNHPEGYPPSNSDGNVMRFVPYNKSSGSDALNQTFRTVLVALDSSKGGGTVLAGNVYGSVGDFRMRDGSTISSGITFSSAIWSASCSENVKNGVTRLNGAVVDQTKGFTGAPEVLSLTAAGDVSAMCVDTLYSTESSNGTVLRSYGIIHGEMLMYDSELDANVLANLEAYLMGKWTGVLPDGWSDLRGATVTGGAGTVTAPFAKLPAFGDAFTGTIAMPDAAFTFTYDGSAENPVLDAFVARGATIDLPAAVTVTVNCSNVHGASATLFDVAAFANPVEWTLVANGAGDKNLVLREDNGKLMLDVVPTGLLIIVR